MLNQQQLKKVYGNEQLLLVLLARLYFSTASQEEITKYIEATDINWDLFLQIAEVHGIRSFCYHLIIEYKLDVPDHCKETLEPGFIRARQKSLHQLFTVSNICADLSAEGITAIPYKGAIFAQRYYKDISMRESIDIDLLIGKGNIRRADNYFMSTGYAPLTPVPLSFLSYYISFFKDLVYSSPQNAHITHMIEVHWRLVDRFAGKFPAHVFFKPHLLDAKENTLKYQSLPATENLIIMMSNHFVKDRFSKFKYIIDIGCLLQKEGGMLNEAFLLETATKYSFKKRMNIGFALVNELTGVTVPGIVSSSSSVDSYLRIPLLFPLPKSENYITSRRFLTTSLALQDNRINKIVFVCRCFLYIFLPTTDDIGDTKLPLALLPFYIIARPFRLLFKNISTQIKRS